MKKIKVLVVEDSLLFRNLWVQTLSSSPLLEVVAAVTDPYEARDAILEKEPDVMTLDIELPKMDGISFLKQLIPQYPLPVVVISTVSNRVFDALNAGAVDFVHKPAGMNHKQLAEFMKRELVNKVITAASAKVSGSKEMIREASGKIPLPKQENFVVAIGASTGGTEAIYDVISKFHTDIPGVVVVQHMPPGFTRMYADRLNNQCEVRVKEAENKDIILPGTVLIAPGDKQMRVRKTGNRLWVECFEGEKVSGHCPSVDVLFQSVAEQLGERSVGVLLTGMGRDGASGLASMRESGAITIGQDERSCVVYGMPRAAYELGAVRYQLTLGNIANKVYEVLR